MQLPPQPVAVGEHGVIEVFQQFVDGVVGHGAFSDAAGAAYS
jgi:hypothetical protein